MALIGSAEPRTKVRYSERRKNQRTVAKGFAHSVKHGNQSCRTPADALAGYLQLQVVLTRRTWWRSTARGGTGREHAVGGGISTSAAAHIREHAISSSSRHARAACIARRCCPRISVYLGISTMTGGNRALGVYRIWHCGCIAKAQQNRVASQLDIHRAAGQPRQILHAQGAQPDRSSVLVRGQQSRNA